MDGEIVFETESFSVAKDWIQAKESDLKETAKTAKNQEHEKSKGMNHSYEPRLGLGATLSSKDRRDREKAEDLKKHFQKKRKRQGHELDQDTVQQHGVAVGSEDEEESRIQAVSKKKKSKQDGSSAGGTAIQTGKNKKRKKKKKKGAEGAKEGVDHVPLVSETALQREANAPKKFTGPETDHPAETYPAQQKDQNEGQSLQTGARPRKKKKTRSKQKNIRKDNRTSSQRPVHLQYGRKEYCGRELTKETAEKLSLPRALDVPIKPSNPWATSSKPTEKTSLRSKKGKKGKKGKYKNLDPAIHQ